MNAAYTVSLVCIIVVCIIGVLNPRYHDTLGQRVGMGLACMGAVGELYALLADTCRLNASSVLIGGVALFAVATLWKKYRLHLSA